MLSARSKALWLAFVRSIAHRIFAIVATPIPPDRSASVSFTFSDASGASRRHTKRPWRRVTSRERVGENLVDFAFVRADVLWLIVLLIRPVSFVSMRGTFHVRCLSSSKRKMSMPAHSSSLGKSLGRAFSAQPMWTELVAVSLLGQKTIGGTRRVVLLATPVSIRAVSV
jgi:hypothetical protein